MCFCVQPCVSFCGFVRAPFVSSPGVYFKFGGEWLITSGEDSRVLLFPICFQKSFFPFSGRHSHCRRSLSVRDNWRNVVSDQSLSTLRLCKSLCVSIAAFFHPSSCMWVCAFFVLVHRDMGMWLHACVCVCVCVGSHVWMVSHLSPSLCACTHVDTLSVMAPYGVRPPEEHPPSRPTLWVYRADTR